MSELQWSLLDKKIVIIHGPRGIGKTELARKYAQNMKHDNTSSILWLDSTTHESLINSFKDLAVDVGKSLEGKSVTAVLRDTFDFFKNRQSIFVLDHASSDNIIIKNLNSLMGRSKRTQILVTSRDDDWDETYRTIKLDPFSKDNSLEYIKVVLRKEINMSVLDATGERLAALLRNLPLALRKATGYIIHKNTIGIDAEYTVEDYIEDLKRKQVEIEVTTAKPAPSDTEVDEGIMEKIEQEGKRIGDQISDGAKEAWEKISDESSRVGTSIANEAERTGKRISNEAARFEEKVRDFFSFG